MVRYHKEAAQLATIRAALGHLHRASVSRNNSANAAVQVPSVEEAATAGDYWCQPLPPFEYSVADASHTASLQLPQPHVTLSGRRCGAGAWRLTGGAGL